MNITKENIDDLNAVIKIKVEKEDYEETVKKTLSDYRKNANMPGFRKGKVPFGMIKKMYGKPVLVDEINKLVSQNLSQYIVEQQLKVLGEPLPSEKEQPSIDWDNQDEFEFAFDIGLSPEFEINLDKLEKINYYELEPDQEFLENQINQYKSQYGQFIPAEQVSEKSMITGDMTELDENNEPKPEGIVKEEAKLSVEIIKDEDIKKQFIGAGMSDILTFNVKTAYPNDTEVFSMLNIKKEEAEALSSDFQLVIKEISDFQEASLDQELFDKVYGEDEVTTEEEFRERVREDIKKQLLNDSDYKFHQDAKEALINNLDIEIPAGFLKRWIKATNQDNKDLTEAQIENDFPQFEKDVKWQLIKSKISNDNNLEVTDDELKEYTKELARMQFMQYGITSFEDEHLENYANEVLQKEDEKNKLKDRKKEEKVIDFIKNNAPISTKKIDTKEFNNLLENEKNKT